MKENEANLRQQVKERREGEIFHPFENMPVLQNLNLTEHESLDCHVLWSNEFTFKNASAIISIMTEENFDSLQSTVTPLGKVKKVIANENGKIGVEEYPLNLGLDLDFKSVDDYRNIQGYAIKFNLGNENYYLNLGGGDNQKTMEHLIQSGENGETFDYSLKNEKGNDMQTVLLPYDTNLLKKISAQIVKKDLPR
jgi:hypothetical protein